MSKSILRLLEQLIALNGKAKKKENGEQSCDVSMNLNFTHSHQLILLNFWYRLWLILGLLFLFTKTKMKSWDLLLWARWGCGADGMSEAQHPLLHFLQSASCKDF